MMQQPQPVGDPAPLLLAIARPHPIFSEMPKMAPLPSFTMVSEALVDRSKRRVRCTPILHQRCPFFTPVTVSNGQ